MTLNTVLRFNNSIIEQEMYEMFISYGSSLRRLITLMIITSYGDIVEVPEPVDGKWYLEKDDYGRCIARKCENCPPEFFKMYEKERLARERNASYHSSLPPIYLNWTNTVYNDVYCCLFLSLLGDKLIPFIINEFKKFYPYAHTLPAKNAFIKKKGPGRSKRAAISSSKNTTANTMTGVNTKNKARKINLEDQFDDD